MLVSIIISMRAGGAQVTKILSVVLRRKSGKIKKSVFTLGIKVPLYTYASYMLLFNMLENNSAPNLLILMEFFSINIKRY